MKRAIFTLALTLTAVAIGCGGGESDEDQVRGTIEAFAAANVDKDWSGACDQLTDEARKALSDAGELFGGEGCAGILKAAICQLSPAERKKEFGDLKIRTSRSTATTRRSRSTARTSGWSSRAKPGCWTSTRRAEVRTAPSQRRSRCEGPTCLASQRTSGWVLSSSERILLSAARL